MDHTTGDAPPAPTVPARLAPLLRAMIGPQAIALIACVMFGVALGVGLRAPGGAFDNVDGRLLARGSLAQALDERLAAEPSTDGTRLGPSFASRQGLYCRVFMLAPPSRLSGVACLAGGRWQMQMLVSAPAGDTSGMAPAELLRAIDERIEGGMFDAAPERRARERGWRP